MTVGGAAAGTQARVALSAITGPSQGEGKVLQQGGDAAKYYSIQVSNGPSPTSAAGVCFTDSSFAPSSQMAYWDGGSWILLPSTFSGSSVCSSLLLGNLDGTDFVVGTGFVTAQNSAADLVTPQPTSGAVPGRPGSPYLLFIIFVPLVIAVAYLVIKRRTGTHPGS